MARILKIRNRFEESKKSRKTLWLILAAVLLLIIIVLNSSLFSLKYVEIEGNERVSDEDIMNDLDLEIGMNLFRYFISHINAEPKVDPRLNSVDIYVSWPDTIRVEVTESMTIGYVYFQGTYLCIDRRGTVASSTYSLDEDLPIIKGIEVGSFSLGEVLDTKDTERYNAVVSLCSVLRKHELSTIVKEVNIRDITDIVIYTDKLEIHCGSMDNMEQKVGVIRSILEEYANLKGVLHVEDLSQQVYFEPIS